jgi:hypothetical protein
VGYWIYGVGFACLGLAFLNERELRERIDMKRFARVADYPRRVHLSGKWFYSGNDAGLQSGAPEFLTGWLAHATHSPWLAEWRNDLRGSHQNARCIATLTLLIESLLHSPSSTPKFPTPEPSRYLPDQQAAIFTAGGMHVTLAGGNNAEAHNHNDLGHVNVWVDDTLVLFDMAAPHYSADFFGPRRYTYLSASSRGHSCPIINGCEQLSGNTAQGKELLLDLAGQKLSLDLTSAYPAEAQLTQWTRTLAGVSNGFELDDEFVTREAVEIENVFWSVIEPKVSGAVVTLGPARLEASPAGQIKVEAVNPADHKLRDYKDTLYRLSFTHRTEANRPLRQKIKISRAQAVV